MSTKSSVSNISGTASLSAKMKRLQIEESLLLQSIFKCVPDDEQTQSEMNAANYLKVSEFNTFSAKTKNSYKEIKLIFQDVKTSTSSKEILKAIDIDDVKKTTLELENRMKTFKSYLQSEQAELKSKEQQLNRDLNENPVLNKIKRHPRIQTAKYNEFVLSPVKTIINSPLKCLEVQQFQEFMMHSINRYGGWNEYYHNIFENQWVKIFGSQIDTSLNGSENCMENLSAFHLFLNELRLKLQDISEEEIISHIKWYSQYLYLKKRQQRAIDKWRSNRTIMKSAQIEPNSKKNCNKRNRSNGRKCQSGSVDNNNITVPGELNDTEVLATKFRNQDKVRCFVRKCWSDDNGGSLYENNYAQHFRNKNARNKILNGCGQPKLEDVKVMNFKKSTKQWHNKINDKVIKIETNLNNLENIKSLGIPIWRAGL